MSANSANQCLTALEKREIDVVGSLLRIQKSDRKSFVSFRAIERVLPSMAAQIYECGHGKCSSPNTLVTLEASV